MNDKDATLLKEIHRLCIAIEERRSRFAIDEKGFSNDEALANMLLMPAFQIGELSGRLSDDLILKTEKLVPWRAIKGFRNIIAHDYANVDANWAWDTIVYDIPHLRENVETILENA